MLAKTKPDRDTKETLELFVARVDRMNKLGLSKKLQSDKISGFTVQMEIKDGEAFCNYPLLQLDERDAFALSLRLFLQDNEKISIRNISKLVNGSSLPDTFKSAWNEARKQFNDYLDSPPLHTDQTQTKRELLDAILYGDLAHLKKKHRGNITLWNTDSVIGPEVYTEFFSLLRVIMKYLQHFRSECKKAIELL